MTKVFIGGSRRVSRLNADVRRRIDRIIEKRLPVLVGDANGADKAVQRFLHDKGYDRVEVFCAGEECRNNVGGWPVRKVPGNGRNRDFAFYATKDRAMAGEASVGLMIWDGRSVGTVLNVHRLVCQHKKAVVYTVPAETFTELNDEADWPAFIASCPADVRRRIERETSNEEQAARPARQPTLL